MTPQPRAAFADVIEKQWLATVIDIAHTYGWMCYHTHDSRHSEPGFPDLLMLGHGRIVFAELKVEEISGKGKVTHYQEVWINGLRAAGQDVYVWRPSDVDQVHAVLGGSVD